MELITTITYFHLGKCINTVGLCEKDLSVEAQVTGIIPGRFMSFQNVLYSGSKVL